MAKKELLFNVNIQFNFSETSDYLSVKKEVDFNSTEELANCIFKEKRVVKMEIRELFEKKTKDAGLGAPRITVSFVKTIVL